MRDLKAALFDLDDTLHDDTAAFTTAADDVAREIAEEHGIDALALKQAYVEEAEGFWHRLSPDQVQTRMAHLRESLWASALERVGLADAELAKRSALNYNAYRNKYFELFPGAMDLLESLRERGVKLGLVTNGFSETHREKLSVLRIADAFDAIFMPDETGMVKPDPMLFVHACRELGVAPAVSAMIGDRYERDIAGAKKAGLYTVWVNVRGETVPEGQPAPDAVVRSIGEVLPLLGG